MLGTSTTLDAEWSFLLTACSELPREEKTVRLRALSRAPVRWKLLFYLADHHRTQPLLHQALVGIADAVPPAEMSALKQLYQINLHKALFLSRELIRIVDHLSALGIEVMPYKGLALAEAGYGDIALRQVGDIDILIRPQDLPRARAAVRELGYTPHLVFSEVEERAYLKSGYECAFDGAAGPNLLELQWAIQPRFYAMDFDMGGLFQRAATITVAGRSMKTPSSEDLLLVLSAHAALAQDPPAELTPAGKAFLEKSLPAAKPPAFPLPSCMFPGGLCGAVRRDGSVAVPPRYDWVGEFADGRAAFRLGGLYGFVDEDGREIVKSQYRVVGDYKFGFAQVDVDGKSGLIDRDGKMVMEPKFGFIEAIAPDRFRVSDMRQLGGRAGADDFSDFRGEFPASGGMSISILVAGRLTSVIDRSGQQIEPPGAPATFDKDDPSIRWVQKDKLWGLARADGSWLAEPKSPKYL